MSSESPRIKQLLEANAKFAETWKNPFEMAKFREVAGDPILVLTCMDPRVVPEEFLGAKPMLGVFRNAGGRYSPDVVRTVAVIRSLSLKAKKAYVMVIHHTDCGMTHLTDDGIREDIAKRHPNHPEAAEGIDFGCFRAEDLEKTILEDVNALKAEKLLEGVDVIGYVLDTETGKLRAL